MKATQYKEVRDFLQAFLARKLGEQGRTLPDDLTDDYDLLLSGLVDSLGLLEMIAALQHQYGSDIDFESFDPEEISVVGPLCRFVAEQAAQKME
jgi:acyl carrier protein